MGDEKFKKEVNKALDTIKEGKGGKALISKLEATKNVITIQQETQARGNGTTPKAGEESKNGGKGLGSTVDYDPADQRGGKDAKGSTTRPPFVGLAHELGHARAIDLGKQSTDRGSKDPGTTPPSELHSMANENMVRKEHGLPERPAYYQND